MEAHSLIKFNVGCGWRDFGPDWFHIDGGNYSHITGNDVSLKYQPNNYIDLIYSSHLIAYFDRYEVIGLITSWFNKLKPGGKVEIATPDFDVLYKLYNVGNPLQTILGPLFGKMVMGDEVIYHKATWNDCHLIDLLKEIGFTNIKRYDHKKTCHPNTGDRNDFYDDHSAAYIDKTLISLNIEATKPL